jgi:hypothetical protein
MALNIIGIEPAADIRVPPEVAEGGALKGWQQAIDAAVSVTDCPHWTLGAAAGFVGPVLSRCGLDTCGVNFSGPTSRGKTTAVALGVSTSSVPKLVPEGLLQSMRATENALETAARRSSCLILGLDELAHVDGKTLGRVIYFLAGGISKARMSAQLKLRERYTWRTFALLSSEKSLAQKIIGDGGEWAGGMAVRFPDIDCSEVEANVPRATLTKIGGIYDNYGVAIGPFAQAFMDGDWFDKPDELRAKIFTASDTIAGADADGARRRAALPFALIGVCGTLAREYGFLPAATDIKGAVKWGWGRFIRSTEALALAPYKRALVNLRRWIAEHWDSALKKIGSGFQNTRDAVGWYDDDAIYIPTDRMLEAVGGVLSVRPFVRKLDENGLLLRRTDDQRLAVRSVPKIGKVDVYCLDRKAFRDD